MHGVGMERAPEAFIDLLNLLGEAFPGVKSLLTASTAAKCSLILGSGPTKLRLGSPCTLL